MYAARYRKQRGVLNKNILLFVTELNLRWAIEKETNIVDVKSNSPYYDLMLHTKRHDCPIAIAIALRAERDARKITRIK